MVNIALDEISVAGLYIGKIKSPWPGKPATGILKHATTLPTHLSPIGFQGDQQADLRVHGGVEKAAHHYPAEHYRLWMDELGENPTFEPGGFGENISTFGMTEKTMCIGDILRLGGALVQISQGRQPCWKLNEHTSVPEMALLFQKTGRTGWYYRVLEPGVVCVGEPIDLVERLNPEWSVERVTLARLSPRTDPTISKSISQLRGLAPRWREAFEKKSKRELREDVKKRLEG